MFSSIRNSLPFLFFCFTILSVFAQEGVQMERITNFEVIVTVNKDRSIDVTELISVYATGNQIKRGITRSFPSRRNLNGRSLKMRYQHIKIEKDGEAEPFFKKSGTLYIGDENIFLEDGNYTYKIEYHVPSQIGQFENYDEIYWNAIGTDVKFTIEKSSCQVFLPPGSILKQETAYIGFRGEDKKDHTYHKAGTNILYIAKRPLSPGEGFTVAIGFEEGALEPVGIFQKYGTIIILFIGLLFLFPYYIYTWVLHGKDPETPASYPIFETPDGLSAASINYIAKKANPRKSFTASVVSLAVKGFLKIQGNEVEGFFKDTTTYTLINLKKNAVNLPKEEKELLSMLFADGGITEITLDGEYQSSVESAYLAHQQSLSAQHRSFLTKGNNRKYLWIPIFSSIGIGVLALIILNKNPYADGINVPALIAFTAVALVSLILYTYLIKQPTLKKLGLQSRIKGFKMYLEMAEKNRLNLQNPPELTTQHFEEILPFAFALGVEHHWSEYFKSILAAAQYQPEWNNHFHASNFGNSFSTNLRNSSIAPSQSSSGGSGGGGFSGGGGGGGGVGGW